MNSRSLQSQLPDFPTSYLPSCPFFLASILIFRHFRIPLADFNYLSLHRAVLSPKPCELCSLPLADLSSKRSALQVKRSSSAALTLSATHCLCSGHSAKRLCFQTLQLAPRDPQPALARFSWYQLKHPNKLNQLNSPCLIQVGFYQLFVFVYKNSCLVITRNQNPDFIARLYVIVE